MKKNKALILSLVICLLPLILVAAVYHRLPETVVTHWNAEGVPDGWSPRWFMLLLPVMLAGVQLVCHFSMKHGDPRTANAAHAMGTLVYWVIPAVSVFATGVTIFTALGMEVPVTLIAQLLVACVLIFIGNYLPKCRQNSVIGVRMPWTLSDADNWNFTHRVTGRAWMICGVLMLPVAFLEVVWAFYVLLAAIIIVPFAASLGYKLRNRG